MLGASIPGGKGASAKEAVRLQLTIGLCKDGHTEPDVTQADSRAGGGTFLNAMTNHL